MHFLLPITTKAEPSTNPNQRAFRRRNWLLFPSYILYSMSRKSKTWHRRYLDGRFPSKTCWKGIYAFLRQIYERANGFSWVPYSNALKIKRLKAKSFAKSFAKPSQKRKNTWIFMLLYKEKRAFIHVFCINARFWWAEVDSKQIDISQALYFKGF